MRKNLLVMSLIAITLLTFSCKKYEFLKDSVSATSSVSTNVNTNSSSTEDPALLLAKFAGFTNQTYLAGPSQQSFSFVVQNGFNNPVRIDIIQVSFFSNSSTENIPANALTDLILFNGSSPISYPMPNPLVNGGINSFNPLGSTIIQPSGAYSISGFLNLLNPPYSFFAKMRIFGTNTVTGQQVSTTIAIGQTITVIAGAGTLTATFDAYSSTKTQYIACGENGVQNASSAVFNIRSTPLARIITELKFSVISSQISSVTMVKVNGISAPVIAGTAWITGLNIPVPAAGAGVDVEVFLSYAGVGVSGIPSGTIATISLIQIRSVVNATSYINNFSVPAVPMILVASKPTVYVDQITMHTGLVLGQSNKISEVTVTADARGNILQNAFGYRVTTSGISPNTFGLSNYQLYRNGVLVPGTTITNGVAGPFLQVLFPPSYQIPAGTSATFQLYAVVSGIPTGSYMSVRLALFPDKYKWTDYAGNGINGAEDGINIYNFPVNDYWLVQ